MTPRSALPAGMEAPDVAAAVAEASIVQQAWAARPVRERLRVVSGLRQRLVAGAEAAADAISRPGRPRHEALVSEVVPLADACRFLEREAARLLAPRRLGWRGRPAWLVGVAAEVRREPFGVVLVVAPANYPLLLPGVQVLQALAAGNAVVVKPAPGCGGAMAMLAGWLAEAGLPHGVLRVLGEDVGNVADALTAGVGKVVLTGSAETGRRVLAALAERLVPSTMELSGNDAVFVLPGADVGLVARALAFGLRFNGSATCIAPRRVFVPPAEAAALERALLPMLAAVPAAPMAGPVRRAVSRLVADAVESGARLLGSPPDPDAAAMSPVVVADARPEMALLRQDIFAPVLALVAVADMEEALILARQSPYALGASVFGPLAAAEALASRIDAGSVTVNDLIVPTADPRLPFGGRRQSGWGVTRGAEGLLEMTQVKTVSTRHRGPAPHLDPPRPEDDALILAAFRVLHGRGRLRLDGLRQLLGAVRRRPQRTEK